MKIKLGITKADMEAVSRWCGGELYDFTGERGSSFEYVCTDSREADENTMFVATRGERVDGHDYIIKAIEQGCRCILCEYVPTNISGKQAAFVVVENSIEAFADCARATAEKDICPRSPSPEALVRLPPRSSARRFCRDIVKPISQKVISIA